MTCKGINCTYNHPHGEHSRGCIAEHDRATTMTIEEHKRGATMTGEEQLLHWIELYKDKRDKETCPAMIVTLNNMIKNLENMIDEHDY